MTTTTNDYPEQKQLSNNSQTTHNKPIHAHIQLLSSVNMKTTMQSIGRRSPPQIGSYDVVKCLDPRFLDITFRANDHNVFVDPICNYMYAYDREDQIIEDKIRHVNGLEYWVRFACLCVSPSCTQYYMSYITKRGESKNTSVVFQTYIGDDLQTSIFEYMDYVSETKINK